MRYTSHVATDVPPSVVYPRVNETQKGRLDQLARAKGHHASIFARDPELKVIKEVDILQKCASISQALTNPGPVKANSVSE
ncbi:hypothetical protein A0H81_07295 [Grifola frondosa]|uniref:Uncharacterized protein n=1 Tax=Grifola frondosa TaxID=5627 RepID=A0A1C7M969_GRIFR|nr:hypothetical protein A0H81_07295 [Grifola frondosa]